MTTYRFTQRTFFWEGARLPVVCVYMYIRDSSRTLTGRVWLFLWGQRFGIKNHGWGQRFCTKNVGVANFARHSPSNYLYKSAQKASKESYTTIISSLNHIHCFHFKRGSKILYKSCEEGSQMLYRYIGVGWQISCGPELRKNRHPIGVIEPSLRGRKST